MEKEGNTDTPHSNVTMRRLPLAALLLAVLMSVVTTSCRDEKKLLLTGDIDPERFPTMRTIDVSTLISDSGITRYKITAPVWLVFDESHEPQWKFPQGLHLEKYDDFFRRDATVDCDSATYFKVKQLWRLDGYVDVANMQGEKFLTQQLYWDQRQHKIYSDSFIHIEKSDRVIEGYGFESDERMTKYHVRNVSGIFPVDQFKNDNGADNNADAADGDTTSTVTTVVTRGTPARRSLRGDSMPTPATRHSQPSRPAINPELQPAQPTPAPTPPPSPLKRTPSIPKHNQKQ